jgi:hypothetical protein
MKNFTFTVLVLFPFILFSQIIHIPADYSTIQEGIDAAQEFDTVLVEPGTYVENLWFMDKNIVLASHYLITMDTNYISQTIIDGGESGPVLLIEEVEQETHICGLTLRNGNTDQFGGGLTLLGSMAVVSNMIIESNTSNNGGGVFIGDGKPLLKDIRILNNVANQEGGGIMANNCSLHLNRCSIKGNQAGNGAALMYRTDFIDPVHLELFINKCIVQNNAADMQTGGLYFRKGFESIAILNIMVSDCHIIENTAFSSGGIQVRGQEVHYNIRNCKIIGNTVQAYSAGLICMGGSFGSIINCVFARNEAALNGESWNGGGCTLWGSEADVYNCTFVGNMAKKGGGLVVGPNSEAFVYNSIFRNNQNEQVAVVDFNEMGGVAHIDYSNIHYGRDSIRVDPLSQLDWRENNIDTDPLFLGSGDDEYALSNGSPCIDKGIPDISGMEMPPFDILLNFRLWDGNNSGTAIIDMGAYEFDAPAYFGINEPHLPYNSLGLIQNIFPNPARDYIRILFSDQLSGSVLISLFSSTGQRLQEVKTTVSPTQPGYELELKGLARGLYFVTVQSGVHSETRKIVLNR